MNGQRARFTQILRHCRYDGFRSGNRLASNCRENESRGGRDVNPADECLGERSSRLGLPINDNRLLFRARFSQPLPRISRRICYSDSIDRLLMCFLRIYIYIYLLFVFFFLYSLSVNFVEFKFG